MVTATPIRTKTAFDAVVFDMDGVLVHSAPCHSAAFQNVLQKYFGISDFEYAPFAGWRTRDVIEAVLADKAIEASSETIAAASAEKTRVALDLIENSATMITGIIEVLTELRDCGFVLALASSGSPQSVQSFLKSSSSSGMFRSVLTGGDVSQAKPNPEIYSRTFEAIGVDPQRCLVVEDAVAGVIAAIRAGGSVVGVAGTCSEADLSGAGAIAVLSSVRVLPAWLRKFNAAQPGNN
jgi:HAD superfamily hydrolase (TIGR01509 family)